MNIIDMYQNSIRREALCCAVSVYVNMGGQRISGIYMPFFPWDKINM